MEPWTINEALKWADNFAFFDENMPNGDEVQRGDVMALYTLAREVRRLRNRVEQLRWLCKSCSGWLLDKNDIANSELVLTLVGDMEPPLQKTRAD